MEKMKQGFEKVKMLVGMEVDEEEQAAAEESSSSFAFVDDFNRNCTLSTKQRFYGFAICFVAGLACTILSLLVFLNPVKFGITFTFGNLLSLGSTAFLIGFQRQLTMMLDPVRIYATALYLASIIIALFCALYVHNKLLTLLAIILEFGALIWRPEETTEHGKGKLSYEEKEHSKFIYTKLKHSSSYKKWLLRRSLKLPSPNRSLESFDMEGEEDMVGSTNAPMAVQGRPPKETGRNNWTQERKIELRGEGALKGSGFCGDP